MLWWLFPKQRRRRRVILACAHQVFEHAALMGVELAPDMAALRVQRAFEAQGIRLRFSFVFKLALRVQAARS